MIPRTWSVDLTERERLDLGNLLNGSPGLWPFGIAAGTAGLDQAVDCCRDPSLITANVADKLRKLKYPVEACLPSYADILAILMGVRLRHRMQSSRPRRPLQTIARELGLDLAVAQDALRTLHAHSSTPAYEVLGL